jgi:hypothetical protein
MTYITKVILRTELLYYGSDTQEDADAMSDTEVELVPSNIGSTIVPEPVRYESPENAAILSAALENMKQLDNYKYSAKDVTTYAPSGDSGDYEISAAASNDRVVYAKVHNYTSSVGTVGEVGFITKDAILIENTGKYSYAMDDKLYHTEYYGYKQNEDGTYDEFEYQASAKALVGTRKVTGIPFCANSGKTSLIGVSERASIFIFPTVEQNAFQYYMQDAQVLHSRFAYI